MTRSFTTVGRARRSSRTWIYSILLVYILLAGAFFRFSGIFWGEYQYLHPDERFLVWVGTDISPVESLKDYFDTPNSSLNPHNRGHGFYVYGTLPMFIARYIVEWVFGGSGFMEMTQVGRSLSALADLVTVLLVYLVAERLYSRRVGVLAAAFSAAAVLPIQQSHFFTMDTFINTFSFLAFYFAILIIMSKEEESEDTSSSTNATAKGKLSRFIRDPFFWPSLGFGVALGMAVASKLNAAPMAVVLPAAMGIHLFTLPSREREKRAVTALIYLCMAALISLLVFRLFQPYAFSGPGFFGIQPNPQWVANIRELRAQSSGDVDFPPAMQWARRPIWFSFQNMVLWGLGLPLGMLAWGGFLWAGLRMITGKKRYPGEWLSHSLIWGWTAIYFTWQSLVLNPTMRYQLPIYPTLAIFAGWALVALYYYPRSVGKGDPSPQTNATSRSPGWTRPVALLVGAVVLVATYAYAFAFTRIYTRPITRVEASRWIYQNIPGPIVLPIQGENGIVNQSLPVAYDQTVAPGAPYSYTFQPKQGGLLSEVYLPRIADETGDNADRTLKLSIALASDPGNPLSSTALTDDLTPEDDPRGNSISLKLEQPIRLDPSQTYVLRLELPGEVTAAALDGELILRIEPGSDNPEGQPVDQSLPLTSTIIRPNAPYYNDFTAAATGYLNQIYLGNILGENGNPTLEKLRLSLEEPGQEIQSMESGLTLHETPSDQGFLFDLDQPLPVTAGKAYTLALEMQPLGGSLALKGLGVANEGDWDDGLPLRMEGYDGFGGIYPLELNFNMYWDDNLEKLGRFLRILDETDYVVISSNRQWGSLPRLPERFPMTTVYYRNLIGCPEEMLIENCYRVAKPGMFKGNLGFDLVQVFQSNPKIGPLELNDQFAEEAFTVYDHPKVLIFKKTDDYNSEKARQILGSVDFSKVIRIPPMRASSHPADLMLPDYRLAEQRQDGTWSEIFNTQALQNRFPVLGVLFWYLSVALLGWIVYPLLRLAAPGLADRGYPMARTAGMLLLSYVVWLAGSMRVPFTRPTISAALLFIIAVGAFLAFIQRGELRQELRNRWRYFVVVEALALAFFLAFLLVRVGNPDLWHPWKGGEKPMDFSYFNAVLKSTTFPPYDPWFAGGYLNYYYYGFVLVGVLVKWLGIVPAIAYNLILPTLFSLVALGGFSLAWNLFQKPASRDPESPEDSQPISPYIPAIAASFGLAVLGNLGTVRMIYQGYQKLIAPGGVIEGAGFLTRFVWAVRGFLETLKGVHLPYSIGDWYWLPSRAIPAPGDVEPITEFPFFTVLYADLHAHLLALPLTLLALGLSIGIVLGGARWKTWLGCILGYFITALAIGALRPTNTWDFPPYLVLGTAAVGYALWRNYQPSEKARRYLASLVDIPENVLKLLVTLGGMALLAGLSFLLFQPFAEWYALGYTKIGVWEGTHTPTLAYLTHWGLFLFLIVSWMAWDTRDWMAKTPMSALRRLLAHRLTIQALLVLLVVAILGLIFMEVSIAWFVIPLAAWAGVLLLRPKSSEARRIVLFLVGTGLMLTLMVEMIVLKGDIGRMNTVFKFYLQVWTMISVSAAVSLGWLLNDISAWALGWRRAWQFVLTVLVLGATFYTLLATTAKIKDRMASSAPHTLDGMAYMPYATYTDEWGTMDLSQDYRAIRWMQENVEGSPVIVEANLRNLYRWGSRFSIYTGLPGVVGWEWHQQQQRAVVPGSWVSNRIAEIDDFYLTTDWQAAESFLHKYDVQYIIVGQQERGHYPGPGLEKFEAAEGQLWREVYRDSNTLIYEVL